MRKIIALAVLCIIPSSRLGGAAEADPAKARPAAPRQITVTGMASLPPLFATNAKTFDPVDLARESLQGWISKRGIPWGMTPELKPMLRLSFDCRALPWPSIKQHSVDGPDNNMRAVDALALLHAMLGDEFQKDPAEAGIIAYLSSCTDPATGIPYSPDSMSRSCAIGHGEHTKNLILMHRYTGKPEFREWAERALKTLRYYGTVSELAGVGQVATYKQGMFVPGQPPVTETTDPTLGGWLHLALGWNLWAFSEHYELSHEKSSLDFAVALGNRLYHSEDANGDGGCFRPDGSFGGKSQASSASWHMHGHTHCLPSLTHLGGQLIQSGQRETGLRFITQASRTLDWLYDPERNPDAGSLTGWLGEWLMVATGWTRKADCEGCTVGDVVQTACALGAASRLHPDLKSFVRYYDRAEQIYTGQLSEQTFRLRSRYLEVVKANLIRQVDSEPRGEATWRDQSSSGNHLRLVRGEVKSVLGELPKGPRPVIQFQGNDYFALSNSAAVRLPEFSIHAVVKATPAREGQTIYCNYDNPINWGKGVTLQVNPDLKVYFFTTDGTQANYDAMTSTTAMSPGYHIITATYSRKRKRIRVDGVEIGSAPSKPIDYGAASVATVGALRNFGFNFSSEIAELIIRDSVDDGRCAAVETYLGEKYGIATPAPGRTRGVAGPVLWVKADDGFTQDSSKASPDARAQEVERRYQKAVKLAERMVGQQLGACGFPDWVNETPSDLDPKLPGIHMQGCCADATIRGAHAIWAETVTGDASETRVNVEFNRKSPLVDVISSLPHRGELNVLVKASHKVLVRVPEWAPKEQTQAFVNRTSIPVKWDAGYVVFAKTKKGQQLTVTYPLRLAEVKETVGSLDGRQYTERWRGNTIVDISPPGKWIPLYQRPELENGKVP